MEVGDKVRYKTFEPIEKECECCGHIEIDYKKVKFYKVNGESITENDII